MMKVELKVESDVIIRTGNFSKKPEEDLKAFTERVVSLLKLYIIKAEENDKDLFSAG